MGSAAEFKRFEAEGWSARAGTYGDLTGRVTSRVAVALLDACRAAHGTRMLDLASGAGHVSALAAERGATTLGVDLAEGMVAAARQSHPALEFRSGDAERLDLPDASFDAVAGGFVLNHLPHPERCVREAARVLAPGGRAAFSVWERPERNRLVGLMGDAVERAGLSRDEAIPDGPDSERFADDAEFARLLEGAGFHEVEVTELELEVELAGPDELWHGILGGMVRVASVVDAHSEADRRRIREAFDELCGDFSGDGGGLTLPAVAKIGSGRLPGGGT
jgi:ubiquinone/menaquinone biosynthesis C-methylase UbiE